MKKAQVQHFTAIALMNAVFFLSLTELEAKRHKQAAATAPAPVQTASDTGRIKLDGLEYEILTQAPAGAKTPQRGHTVFVHYTGWVNENGKKGEKSFDSSRTRNEQFSFVLGASQVIPGWDKMVANMKVGEKILVFIPSHQAYGSRGVGTLIPKNANLIFEIELLSIKEAGA